MSMSILPCKNKNLLTSVLCSLTSGFVSIRVHS